MPPGGKSVPPGSPLAQEAALSNFSLPRSLLRSSAARGCSAKEKNNCHERIIINPITYIFVRHEQVVTIYFCKTRTYHTFIFNGDTSHGGVLAFGDGVWVCGLAAIGAAETFHCLKYFLL